MDNADYSIIDEKSVIFFIDMTVPPGEKKHRFDDRMHFINTLALAIASEEGGKLLLEALRKKWPEAVESSLEEARRLVKEAASPSAA